MENKLATGRVFWNRTEKPMIFKLDIQLSLQQNVTVTVDSKMKMFVGKMIHLKVRKKTNKNDI